MASQSSLRGLIIDLITPLDKSGDIDGRGLGRHLDRVLPHAQAVLLASPRGGEGKHLTASHREQLLDKTLVVVRGRVPILVWITQDTEEKTTKTLIMLMKRLQMRKYTGDVFWVDTPLYYRSNRGLPLHFRNMSAITKEPCLLHNDPDLIKGLGRQFKRTNVRTSILKELAGIPLFRGLIFYGSLDRAGNYHKAVRARSEFRIYDGEEAQFLSHPSRSGVISIGANVAPKAWQKITASSIKLGGHQKEYPDRLQQILETGTHIQGLMEVYADSPVPVIKQLLSDMEVIETPFCHQVAAHAEDDARRLKTLLETHGDWIREDGHL